jgi:hypothetical protein
VCELGGGEEGVKVSMFHPDGEDTGLAGVFFGVAASVPRFRQWKELCVCEMVCGRWLGFNVTGLLGTYIIQHHDGLIHVMRLVRKAGDAESFCTDTAAEAISAE